MPEAVDGNPSQPIQVALALFIPHPDAFTLDKGNWLPGVGIH
jgi:hypothetical protein